MFSYSLSVRWRNKLLILLCVWQANRVEEFSPLSWPSLLFVCDGQWIVWICCELNVRGSLEWTNSTAELISHWKAEITLSRLGEGLSVIAIGWRHTTMWCQSLCLTLSVSQSRSTAIATLYRCRLNGIDTRRSRNIFQIKSAKCKAVNCNSNDRQSILQIHFNISL